MDSFKAATHWTIKGIGSCPFVILAQFKTNTTLNLLYFSYPGLDITLVVNLRRPPKDQSDHHSYIIVPLKEIMSQLPMLKDQTKALMWKNVAASLDVKDNLGVRSKQMMYK